MRKTLFNIIKDEEGIAIVVVLGIMLILTVLAFAAIAVSESDLLLSDRDRDSMEAIHVADAGAQKALWQLETLGNGQSDFTFSQTIGSGSADVKATQTGGSEWYWTVESTGTCGNAHRKVVVTVFNFSLWNMNIGAGSNKALASGGNGIVGTTSIDGPFYVRGNVELSGNSQITTGPFFIKTGTLTFLDASSCLGTPTAHVNHAFIEPANGNYDIVDNKGNHLTLQNTGGHLYVDYLTNEVPDIVLPGLDPLATYRTTAVNESTATGTAYKDGQVDINQLITARLLGQPGMTGYYGYYKVLDNDASDSTGPTSSRHTYTLNSDTSSFGLDNPACQFSWNNSTNTLHVDGTVFVDGNLTIGKSSNSDTRYTGRGTLVVNGDININGKLRPPADPLDPNKCQMDGGNVLGLVTNEGITINTQASNQDHQQNPDVSGAFYAAKQVKITSSNTTFVGSLISGVLDFESNNIHLYTDDQLPSFLPPSLPGSTRFLTMTASWREVN